jgi:zinc transport system substrate-binding protein
VRAASRAVVARLEALDRRYRATIDPARDAMKAAGREPTLVVTHDAFGWLARRYGLSTVALTGLNAGEPRAADLRRAIETVRERKLTTVFVEPQVSAAGAQRVAEATGAQVGTLDPLGSGDYFVMMERNLQAIAQALGVPVREP